MTKNEYDNELLDPSEVVTPCECFASCPYDCKGQCGCLGCANAWSDFLSSE